MDEVVKKIITLGVPALVLLKLNFIGGTYKILFVLILVSKIRVLELNLFNRNNRYSEAIALIKKKIPM